MTRQTSFEQLLGAFLEAGHEVTFTKEENGTICMRLHPEHSPPVFSAPSLEEIGEFGICCAVAVAYKKKTSDQGGAGDTRIDGGDEC